ncbi:hypothetical protein PF003_g17044 [Phytophthora fragariae]|nr:hypothetical protein PF003_g17044 [Phytophthora fragariae]
MPPVPTLVKLQTFDSPRLAIAALVVAFVLTMKDEMVPFNWLKLRTPAAMERRAVPLWPVQSASM